MCRNRRVFKGNNLFSKGACLAAKEKANPSGYEKNIRYYGNDRLHCNIGVQVSEAGKEVIKPLIVAGEHWYEAEVSKEVILYGTDNIPIVVEYLNSSQPAVADFTLTGLPMASDRMTRIALSIKMLSETEVYVKAVDLGFGELFPSCGKEWEEEMNLH